MRLMQFCWRLSICGALLTTLTAVGTCQATRTWVSGVGDDANPCSRTAPCKTFAGAISKTAAAGEINCLDPAGFGPLTITKSITVDCTNTIGGLIASGINGIIVNDGGAGSAVVILRNLDINGLRTGLTGVNVISGRSVRLENVKIYGFTQGCLGANTTAFSQISADDSSFSDCGTNGISINTSGSNNIYGLFTRVRISGSANGINAQNGARIVVKESDIFSATVGVVENNAGAGGSQVAIEGGAITLCGTAVKSITNASIGVTGVSFYGNGTVFNAAGGSISSAGDNPQIFNGTTGLANGPAIPKV